MNKQKKELKPAVTLSTEQRAAADFDGNTIVSAGAGCGKTATMIERIVRKLREGVPLEQMLIVTFTRAAAADIRAKLAERLDSMLASEPGSAAVQDAIYSMPVANIGTLHSFCQKLLRSYFFAADIDPAAVIADENEAELIKGDAVRAAVAAGKADADFATVCDMLSGRRNDSGAEDKVRAIVDYALSTPDPYGFLHSVRPDADCFAELDGIVEKMRGELPESVDRLIDAAAAIKHDGLLKCCLELKALLAGEDIALSRKPTVKTEEAKNVACVFEEVRNECKKFVQFRNTAQRAKELDTEPYVRALLSVAEDALVRYTARKAELGKIDYSDLEHGAKKILSDPACAKEITERIRYVFIDEFQDVNPLQADIAECFRKGGATMFLVGDIKQSIYGFRRCDPRFFAQALDAPEYTRFDLTRNYRSEKAVIDFVNDVFSAVMTERCGGVNYADGKNALISDSDDGGSAELVLIDPTAGVAAVTEAPQDVESKTPVDTEGEKQEEERSGAYSVIRAKRAETVDPEIAYIAGRILKWIDPEREGAKLSDIAVIVRSTTTSFCRKLTETLAKLGVPCALGKKAGLRDFPEAEALIDIARCVDNGLDDIALYTALRSPMGGFSDGELVAVAERGEELAREAGEWSDNGKYPFTVKVKRYRGEYGNRLEKFFKKREEFSLYSRCHDCADTLGFITSEIGYFQHVYANSGPQAASAIQSLIAAASAKRCDLPAFIAYCDSSDFRLTALPGGESVTIMTEHSAKGLEFKYVIVAETAHGFNLDDVSARVIVDGSGVAIKYPDTRTGEIVPSAPWLVANARAPMPVRSEELRLLYVSLTRACKRLLVTGKKAELPDDGCQLSFLRGVPYRKESDILTPVAGDTTIEDRPGRVRAAVTAAVKDRCEFDYASSLGADRDLPIKTCVTALASSADDYTAGAPVLTEDDAARAFDRERERSNENADACLRGTAFHRAMELVDFEAPDMDDVAQRCENFELVDREQILRAAAAMSELTANASTVMRERYFIVDLPARSLGYDSDGSILVQGVIDLVAVFPDGSAVIVDYKTTAADRLVNDGYRSQLAMYAAAVERTTPFKVKKTYLYSFRYGLVDLTPESGA